MSYAGRMYFRLYLPSLLVLGCGLGAAASAKAAQELPGDFGGLATYSNLPAYLFFVGLVLAVTIGVAQTFRVKLWERGRIPGCYVCGCLLGAAQVGRRGLGLYRKCLGCGKAHGVNHRLSPAAVAPVPVRVAATDPAQTVAPIRSARWSR
ncbi:hypothetical protein EC912_104306 [Luteibacter rhizovicinus]|uniref:Uncharacterized protein n=1 Tax=Luteibacter rhizovicinus TaxID=242606 RepID=A0A4V2W429_9GAMM|nr:hypothetical protein [Luteibacter rhizovicinus]TCV94109.1 hypothetical protein EC912_104306 [Luteibacter rhizovicinus]